MPKPRVLPVPVRAWPIRSVPSRATGSVISWIGNGSTMLTRSSASQISGSTPSSRKVVRLIASHMLVRTVAGRQRSRRPRQKRRGDTVQAPRTSVPMWARHRRIAHQCNRNPRQRRFLWFAPRQCWQPWFPDKVPGMEQTAFDDPAYRAAAVDLLGVLAYGELTAFERMAEDAKLAPTLNDKAELAALATTEFGHFQQLRDRLVTL